MQNLMRVCGCHNYDESLVRFQHLLHKTSATIVAAYIRIIIRYIIGILIRMESYFQLCIMQTLESYFHNSCTGTLASV